jgi:basic membrane protein A
LSILYLRLTDERVRALATATVAVLIVLAAQSIGLMICAPGEAEADSVKIGLVPDVGGVNDLSFNWSAYQGLLRAEDELGVSGTVYTTTQPTQAHYGSKLQECIGDGNALCIAVGFNLADATLSKANANPVVDFAIVDFTYDSYPSNLRGIDFASDEAGYLAGTLAGMMTVSDVIGAVGGMDIPPVANFIDGYRNAAQCANPDVTVLVTYTGTFMDPDLGAQTAQDMISQDADIIFGVGGLTGNGAVLTATQSSAWGIGVDTDQWLSLFMSGTMSGSDKLLSSAMKRIDNAVYDTISDELSGNFTSGTVRYGLSLQGVGLAPYHETDASVPQRVRGALARAERCIVLGVCDPLGTSCPAYSHVPLTMKRLSP